MLSVINIYKKYLLLLVRWGYSPPHREALATS
nr:MAG TPA: RUBISCO (RIBULOSE-1,5-BISPHOSPHATE CARBOXYLASE(SLASH)OXYGENASE) [Caudoviricetes sp.]